VADLLRGRRPHRFSVEDGEAEQLRMAIALRAARPGSTAPREEFVTALHRRLAEEQDEHEPRSTAQPAARSAPTYNRRRIVQATSLAAGAAVVGAEADHLLNRPGPTTDDQAAKPETLTPNNGQWRTVVASAELPEGGVRSFDLDSVIGFVMRHSAGLSAVSGVCTHLGCRLALNAAAQRLDCPCHNASFKLTGQLIHYQLAVPPRPLPHLQVREVDGMVQVLVPPRNA
jgi:nitrite reductase/ring-hydroxylating ferredoxin subunit